jgi:hypothetical protein
MELTETELTETQPFRDSHLKPELFFSPSGICGTYTGLEFEKKIFAMGNGIIKKLY